MLYGEIKNLCHYRVGGNRDGITAHIVCQINVYEFYRPCSGLRRNDKKVVVLYKGPHGNRCLRGGQLGIFRLYELFNTGRNHVTVHADFVTANKATDF